jgi:tetratricopeptide (TPR) repeat protein
MAPIGSRRTLKIAAGMVGALSLAGLGSHWWASRQRADPDRLWFEAESAFLSGQWDQAGAGLKQLERARAKTDLDWMLEAQLAIALGNFDKAHASITQISHHHRIAPQAYLLEGRLWRQQRCVRKAEACFRRALALDRSLIEAHKELIYILGLQSRRREVDAEFHALARLKPLSHHDLFTWALTHFTRWNPDIVSDLDSFITADPDDRYSRLAVVELLLDRPGEEVDAYLERILKPLAESDPDALALRIEFAFNRGRFEEAERLIAKAPASHPRIARIRGEMALRGRAADAAIEHFRQALSGERYDRVSPMHLAQALKLKGNETAAQFYLDRVQRLNRIYNLIIRVRSPKHENELSDLAELGKACEDADLREEARGWYNLAITMNPLDADTQQALARLRRPAGE